MYICNDCHAAFDEPGYRVERECHAWLDDKPVREECYPICPECGSENFEEADYCEYCGDVVRKTELIGGCVCEKCLEEIFHGRSDLVRAYILEDKAAFGEWLHEHMEMF